ncbi:predicted protein [Nematostella vectensis]|uniref:Uncharacterized protein n=3 Tax=Nematostella vectensis TaxID=45351 RepID=A7RTU8_NEMVE|nr:predicted protein [Nematostella vectensis]|eukprot:XP_001637156.1 predicted protein [Nematostella vectensis]
MFSISLNGTDGVRLINYPANMQSVVQQVLVDNWAWRGGVASEREFYGGYEYKLNGNPWWSEEKESIMARYLILKLLEALQGYGWHVIGGFDVSRRLTTKSTLIFQQSAPMKTPLLCISASGSDKLRFINTPDAELSIMREIMHKHWPKKISAEKRKDTALGVSCVQFKMNGTPWHGEDDDKYYARSMMCFLLQALSKRSWKPVLSADVSAQYDKDDDDEKYPKDVHSWWFMKVESPDELWGGSTQYGFLMH